VDATAISAAASTKMVQTVDEGVPQGDAGVVDIAREPKMPYIRIR
jgi:hypothetical protein